MAASANGDVSADVSPDVLPDKKGHGMEFVLGLDITNWNVLSPSKWNDDNAQHFYRGFNVTRYIVENNYIFNPRLDQDFLLLNELLRGTDSGSEWLNIKEKLEEVLGLFFVPGVEKMVKGLFDEEKFEEASALLKNQIENGKYSEDRAVKGAQHALKHYLTGFMERVEESYKANQAEEQDELKMGKRKEKEGVKLDEDVFKCYLETLFATLSWVTCPEKCPKLRKSTYSRLQFSTPTLGTVSPKPAFFVLNCKEEVTAVVEVKPHHIQEFPLYRGHRMPGKRKGDAGQGAAQGEVTETTQTSFPTRDEEKEDDKDQHMDDAFDKDDKFKENETKVETAKAGTLEEIYKRRLEVKEKKQIRCFLPQLLAELMGACNQTTHQFLNTIKETKRFGLAVVGIKVRFVTMVIRDHSDECGMVRYPGPSDIETENVSTDVFMTREINLFKKSHLMMFFENSRILNCSEPLCCTLQCFHTLQTTTVTISHDYYNQTSTTSINTVKDLLLLFWPTILPQINSKDHVLHSVILLLHILPQLLHSWKMVYTSVRRLICQAVPEMLLSRIDTLHAWTALIGSEQSLDMGYFSSCLCY